MLSISEKYEEDSAAKNSGCAAKCFEKRALDRNGWQIGNP
jgi:hypothetical protein